MLKSIIDYVIVVAVIFAGISIAIGLLIAIVFSLKDFFKLLFRYRRQNMSQSAKFQEEICSQWLECENDEIDCYRKQFGDNPTSFKTFAWGYTRAYQNAIKKIKDLLSENRLLYLEESVGEFVDDMEYEFNKQLKETGVMND